MPTAPAAGSSSRSAATASRPRARPTRSPIRPTCSSMPASPPMPSGATKMDRPEWGAVDPVTGEVYMTLTNNNAALRSLAATDAANPRHYNDPTHATAPRNAATPTATSSAGRRPATTRGADLHAGTSILFGARADRGRRQRQPLRPDRRQRLLEPRRPLVQPRATGLLLDRDRRRCLHRRHQLHAAGGAPGHGR